MIDRWRPDIGGLLLVGVTPVAYALGQWPLLTTFLEDGHLEIDNNKAENAIRPFVIGRKNWLLDGSK